MTGPHSQCQKEADQKIFVTSFCQKGDVTFENLLKANKTNEVKTIYDGMFIGFDPYDIIALLLEQQTVSSNQELILKSFPGTWKKDKTTISYGT